MRARFLVVWWPDVYVSRWVSVSVWENVLARIRNFLADDSRIGVGSMRFPCRLRQKGNRPNAIDQGITAAWDERRQRHFTLFRVHE
jgi:hypothetical protein